MLARFILLIGLVQYFSLSAFTAEKSDLQKIYLDESKADSLRVDAAIKMADGVYYYDADSAMSLMKNALSWSLRSNYKKGLAVVYGYLGYLYHLKVDYLNAIEFYTTSIDFNLKNGFELERAMDLGNYGALLNEIEDPKAINYFLESIEIYKKYDRKYDLAYLYSSVGGYYYTIDNMDTSKFYYYEGLKLKTFDGSYANLMLNLGRVFIKTNQLDSADYCNNQALHYASELGDSMLIKVIFQNMADASFKRKDFDSTLFYLNRAAQIKSDVGTLGLEHFYKLSSKVYAAKKDFEKAYISLDSAYRITLALHNSNMNHVAIREALGVEFEQKRVLDSLETQKNNEMREVEHKNELKQEAQQRYILYGGISFLVIIVLLAIRGYRQKQKDNVIIAKQKEEVEQQKLIVELKNREVFDSITYAKRIQTAILPSDKLMKEILPDSFVLYKPKDIVAGDFYWLEKHQNKIMIAVADCTGHGVPGAMVSVVCHNALNRSVKEFHLQTSSQILDKTREIVIAEFEKSVDDVKDGMDIALCVIEKDELQFSGAHNSLIILRRGADQLEEIKADKQPVGKFADAKPFQQNKIKIEKGDTIYLFSDGYQDQFGGANNQNAKPGGKKFKSTNFKKLLLSIHHLPLQEQKKKLLDEFELWRGDFEQVDDICIVGIRF